MLYARIYDQAPNYLANAPLSLCQLLHDESVNDDLPVKQFNIPQIFNFAGRSCPIESVITLYEPALYQILTDSFSLQSYVRISPYVFPANFTLEEDIGCGYMNVEARLLKCDDGIDMTGNEIGRNCETLMKSVTMAFLMNEECSNDSGFVQMISDGLTDSPIKLTPDFPSPGQINEAWMQNQNVQRHGSVH